VQKLVLHPKITDAQVEEVREIIQETLFEYESAMDVDEDPEEVFQEVLNKGTAPAQVARRLLQTGYFSKIDFPDLNESGQGATSGNPENPTDINAMGKLERGQTKISIGELEGLSTREKIRRCYTAGMTKPEITKFLGIRAQMVQNAVTAMKERKPNVVYCKVCGRPLTDEGSQADGIGPICLHRQ
jgi:Family of unknown function (DUF6011)